LGNDLLGECLPWRRSTLEDDFGEDRLWGMTLDNEFGERLLRKISEIKFGRMTLENDFEE
jgi:hypothetical protein